MKKDKGLYGFVSKGGGVYEVHLRVDGRYDYIGQVERVNLNAQAIAWRATDLNGLKIGMAVKRELAAELLANAREK